MGQESLVTSVLRSGVHGECRHGVEPPLGCRFGYRVDSHGGFREEAMRLMLCVVLTCLALLPHGCYASPVDYVGCLVPTGLEDVIIEKEMEVDEMFKINIPFTFKIQESPSMTIQICVERCWLHKYEFAALQHGEECYCEHKSKDLSAVTDQFCRIRCRGNSLQRCGGKFAFSVYQTGYEKAPLALRTHYNLAVGYLGCFEESKRPGAHQLLNFETRVPTIKPLVSGRMTAQLCAAYCLSANQAVAVLEDVNKCSCRPFREEWLRAPCRVADAQCNLPCLGGSTTIITTTVMHNCVGRNNGQRYVTAYDTQVLSTNGGLPKLPISTFYPASGWLNIHFPAGNDFEETPHLEGYALTKALAAVESQRHIPSVTVIEPDNTAVGVVEIMGEQHSDSNPGRTALMVFVVISSIGIIAAVFLILTERYWRARVRRKIGPARRYVRCIYGARGSSPSPQCSPQCPKYRPQPDPYSYTHSIQSWRTKRTQQQRRAFS
ncbi:uncharacterized protein LOC112570713 [Pomacea canaliculata]|uniref:uncharacterized protein LOC112570713 n=1 Tax=Pomacea canaliculata TaxID=400727 RepID=UPI000D737C78|nr:uncharacterized protein LOC112570713 [Pomacea canaliculata]